jgi:fibronectin type 3 domain-containing protein
MEGFMKKILLIGFCVMLALFGCKSPHNDDDDGNTGTNQNNGEEPQTPETQEGWRYAQGLWGEWIRIDTAEVWHITSDKASYVKSDTSETVDVTASVQLKKEPEERVIEVTEGARRYFLYASRTATARFTGKIANEAGGSLSVLPSPSANVIDGGADDFIDGFSDGPLFSFGAATGVTVSARNITNSANTVQTTTDEYGDFAIEGIIPGDEYELSSGGQTTVVRPLTDGSDVGVITLTSGLNFKTSITPVDENVDMALLYAKHDANDTSSMYQFNIDVQNTGSENCNVAIFSLAVDPGLVILEQPANRILGTIVPGAKKTIPVTVSCDVPESANVLKKIYVTIQGVGKLWNDTVALRFHKTTTTYYFASALPTQGIVIAPDAKTYHFKTNVVSEFNGAYTTTLTMPWSNKDYLVVFSGATLETESPYSFNVNAAPNADYVSNVEFALANEPANDREIGATSITENEGATGYLHTGDIDYYKVNLGEAAPEAGSGEAAFDAPSGLRATGTDGGITLNWMSVYGTASYKVHRSIGSTDNWSLIDTVASSTYSDAAVNYATVYYYKVSAVNAAGYEGSFSGTAHAQKAPLAIPANFRAEAASTTSIVLNWNGVANASAYYIYRSLSFAGTYTQIAEIAAPGTTYTNTGLVSGSTYYYKIRARTASNGGYYSEYSAAVNAAVSTLPPPATVTTTVNSGSSVTITWAAVPEASYYNVYRATSLNGEYVSCGASVSGTSWTNTGLTGGTAYYYKVSAYNSGGYQSAKSQAAQAITPLSAPAAPTVAVGNTNIAVSWQAVTGATAYEVWYGTSSNSASAAKYGGDVTGLSAVVTGLANGTTYYVWVKAKTSVYTSGFSGSASGVPSNKGFFKGATFATAIKIGNQTLEQSLSYISSNAVSGDKYYIVLGADETVAPKNLTYSNKTVGITLLADGVERTIQLASNGSLFTVNRGVTLTLENNVTLKGRTDNSVSLVKINSSGTLIMNGGKISGNTASSYGGGVYVISSSTFEMNGGEISGNTASSYGGGVFVSSSGTFEMSDGQISGNTASTSGGGVYVGGGTFDMNGGVISGNTASSGGGVHVRIGTFEMSGGEISGNTASSYYGGGVYVYTGTFIKSSTGGVITGYGNDTVNGNKVLLNGVIQSNRGHAVYVSSSRRLENTVPANKALDSHIDGEAGGWTE